MCGSRRFELDIAGVMILLLAIGGASGSLLYGEEQATKDTQAAKQTAIRISKETTWLTEPLDERGYMDYLAALEAMNRQGVTPENNFVVVLRQTVGPIDLDEAHRTEYFQSLGIDPLPAEGDYFVDWDDFVEALPKAERPKYEGYEDLPSVFPDLLYARPWNAQDHPVIARWLKEQQDHLDRIAEASRRPKYYAPLLRGGALPNLVATPLLDLLSLRAFARALTLRAMLSAGSGYLPAAERDLLAVHRIARLLPEPPMLVSQLIAIALDGIAAEAERGLALHGKLTKAQINAYRAELKKLPPLPPIVKSLELVERMMYLDTVQFLSHADAGSLKGLFDITGVDAPIPAEQLLLAVGRNAVDWNEIMVRGNQFFDRLTEIGKIKDSLQRRAKIKQLMAELHQISRESGNIGKIMARLAISGKNVREEATRQMGNVLISLLMPSFGATFDAQDRHLTQNDLTEMIFALAAYRADHGAFPERLEKLQPEYLKELPSDRFTGKPLRYELADGEFTLGSAGPNGMFDGDWDDIIFRSGK